MSICEELAAGSMTGFLISSGHAPGQANHQNDGVRASSEADAPAFIMLFGRLNLEIAGKLSLNFKTIAELCTRPTTDDLGVQKRALALLAKAIEYIDRDSSYADAAVEYREG